MSDTFEANPVAVDPADFSGPQSTDPADRAVPAAAPAPETPELPPEAAVPEPPPGQKYPKWEMERIRVMTRVNSDLKKELAAREERIRVMEAAYQRQGQQPNAQENTPPAAAPEQKPENAPMVYTPAQLEARAAEIAQAQAQQQTMETELRSFAAKGASAYQDWGDKIAAFNDIGGLDAHPEFVKAVLTLPNGPDVLYTLGSNLDQAHFMLNNLSGMQQAVALAQLAGSLAAAAPPPGGQEPQGSPPVAPTVSRAPPPTRPVGGRPSPTQAGNIYDPNISMEQYAKLRSKPA
jgi:hypothetical protein